MAANKPFQKRTRRCPDEHFARRPRTRCQYTRSPQCDFSVAVSAFFILHTTRPRTIQLLAVLEPTDLDGLTVAKLSTRSRKQNHYTSCQMVQTTQRGGDGNLEEPLRKWRPFGRPTFQWDCCRNSRLPMYFSVLFWFIVLSFPKCLT